MKEKPYRIVKEGVILNIKVIPRAHKNEIVKVLDDEIKLKIHAPPVEGKANAEIVKFLASIFKIPKNDVEIIKGISSSRKSILFHRIDKENVDAILSGKK